MSALSRSLPAALVLALLPSLGVAAVSHPETGPARTVVSPEPSSQGLHTVASSAEQETDLRQAMHGKAAVRALGEDLAPVAALNDRSPRQLRELLTEDPTTWVSPTGRLFVKDEIPAAPSSGAGAGLAAAEASYPLEESLQLHSLPGSTRTLYLDFDGIDLPTTSQWAYENAISGPIEGWDPSGDGPGFDDQELAGIQEVWARVAEDYAPFAVDVTTEDPGEAALTRTDAADQSYGQRVVVTDSEAAWTSMCGQDCGGIAWLGTFGAPETNSQYQVAWAFSGGAPRPRDIAQVASHELGHTFGLVHDGHPGAEYDEGHGLWAPLMGAGFDKAVTQWSQGEYAEASNQQDDVALVAHRARLRPDEAGDSLATAGRLPGGTAFITSRDDQDFYALGACSGPVTLTAEPAATGPNLDVVMEVLDAVGEVVASDAPATSQQDGDAVGMAASVTTTLESGRYWVAVDGGGAQEGGAGDPVADYDDYGSLGAYTLSMSGCAGEAAAPGAPTLTTTLANGSLSATWTAPADDGGSALVGYDVTLEGADTVRVAADELSHAWESLPVGDHVVTVAAVNSLGAGVPAVEVVHNRLSHAPKLEGTFVANDPKWPNPDTLFFNIVWSDPQDTGGNPVDHYRFEYEIRPGVWQLVNTMPATPAVGSTTVIWYQVGITLAPGFPEANLRIVPVTAAGDGAPLDVRGHIDGPPMTVGTGDSTVSVTADKLAHTVTVTWTDPYDGGRPLLGTRVSLLVPDPDLLIEEYPSTDVHDVPVGTNTVTFHDVAPGDHVIGIESYNELGGRLGAQFVTMPQLYPPFEVSAFDPVAVAYDRSTGKGTATVSWESPGVPDADTPITGYQVSVDGAPAVTTTDTSYTLDGLALGSSHEVEVAAVNVAGAGFPTTHEFTVQVAPAPVTGLATSVDRNVPGDLAVTGSWSAPVDNGGHAGTPAYEYRLQPVDGDEAWWNAGSSSPVTVRRVEPGAYLFQVQAVNASGSSQVASTPVTVAAPTAPGAPTDLRVTGLDLGSHQATLRWAAPADDGGSAVWFYSVGLKDLTDGTDTGVASDLATRSAPLYNLTTGHRYRVTVSAQNNAGQGAEATHEFVAAAAPGEVGGLQATADRDSRKLSVSWSPPTDDGGAPVEHYYVQLDERVPQQVGLALAHDWSGVASGEHTVTVWADNGSVDDDGELRMSPVAATTVTMLDPTPVVKAPSAPKIGAAKPGRKGGKPTAVFTWSAPKSTGGSAITSYQVDVLTLKKGKKTGHQVFSAKASVRKLEVKLAKKKGVTYVAVVRARNAVGWSAWSARSKAVAPR